MCYKRLGALFRTVIYTGLLQGVNYVKLRYRETVELSSWYNYLLSPKKISRVQSSDRKLTILTVLSLPPILQTSARTAFCLKLGYESFLWSFLKIINHLIIRRYIGYVTLLKASLNKLQIRKITYARPMSLLIRRYVLKLETSAFQTFFTSETLFQTNISRNPTPFLELVNNNVRSSIRNIGCLQIFSSLLGSWR